MFISLTDNGGRRVGGDRRQVNQKEGWIEKRSIEERRMSTGERRTRKPDVENNYERRAMPLFLNAQKNA